MIKKVVLTLSFLIILFIAYNLITQIMTAVKSEERLTTAAEEVYKLEAKNKELRKNLTQIQSSEFIEEHARNELGLGKQGETVVIIPEEKLKQVLGTSQAAVVARLPNFLGWWRVFF